MAASSLRALLLIRPDASSRTGGDIALARRTQAALKDIGVRADLVASDCPQPRGYDVAHIFGVFEPETATRQLETCGTAGVPVAISPIWLDLREFYGRARVCERVLLAGGSQDGVAAKLARIAHGRPERYLGFRERVRLARREAAQAALLRQARVLLPNSAIEAWTCMVRLGVTQTPMIVVPIAADLEPASAWREQRSGIACVGRVETRKNQTLLLFALSAMDVDVDIVGPAYEPKLLEACRRICPRARMHGELPREELLALLGGIEVHALVSWVETAGIASLEAAAAGAKLVVGDRGAEVEYFGDDAEYADPADPESIRAAVRRALARPPRLRGDTLDRRIRRSTWHHAAEETVRAYLTAIGSEAAPAG